MGWALQRLVGPRPSPLQLAQIGKVLWSSRSALVSEEFHLADDGHHNAVETRALAVLPRVVADVAGVTRVPVVCDR